MIGLLEGNGLRGLIRNLKGANIRPGRPEFGPEKSDWRRGRGAKASAQTSNQTKDSPFMFYRTSRPLPKNGQKQPEGSS